MATEVESGKYFGLDSSALVAAYRKLYGEYQVKPAAQRRLGEILGRVETTAPPAAKKGGR